MVVVFLHRNNEATNVQELFDALNDPDEDYLEINEGPISSAIASAIEELLLSAKHKKRWKVWLTECYPKDEQALSILAPAFYKAFSQGRIGRLSLEDLDSTNERDRVVLLAIFATSGPKDDSQHDPMELYLLDCIFDHTMMPHLQSWARDTATFSEVSVRGNCFRWPDTPKTTECIAKIFEQARDKPTDLNFWNVSLIGDMECLWDWRLESIRIGGSSQVHTLLGLSSMAPSLKKLDIDLYYYMDISLTDAGMPIIALLEDPHCCLENLKLSSELVETAFVFSLFQALSNVQSLKRLDMRRIIVDNPSIWHAMIDCLRSNQPSLKELLVHESMILRIPSAADDICDVLRSENHTLEKINFDFRTTIESRELKDSVLPYLVRNLAGRRILLDEQVPPSLMAEVLGRTQQKDMDYFYDINVEKSEVLRADATYHLVREGLSFLFS